MTLVPSRLERPKATAVHGRPLAGFSRLPAIPGIVQIKGSVSVYSLLEATRICGETAKIEEWFGPKQRTLYLFVCLKAELPALAGGQHCVTLISFMQLRYFWRPLHKSPRFGISDEHKLSDGQSVSRLRLRASGL